MINKKPFVIAEISANHDGKIETAKKLILSAKKNGADAVKLQTYLADKMTIKSNLNFFKVKSGLWKGYKLWDLYKRGETPRAWHKELFNYAKKINIKIFSTPFDEDAVDLLEKLKCPAYKVASFEMTDLPLLKKIAKTKKPVILSTGLADLNEISKVVNFLKKNNVKDLTIMYCVSTYPAKPEDFNINNIKILKNRFNCKIGFSDHSIDNKISHAAICAGAEVFEKHIALKNQKGGLDIKFSLKGHEIKKYIKEINFFYKLISNKNFFRNKNEIKNRIFRRSLFAKNNIKKGEKLSLKNIVRVRPGHGISPLHYYKIIGKKSPVNIKKHYPIPKKLFKL